MLPGTQRLLLDRKPIIDWPTHGLGSFSRSGMKYATNKAGVVVPIAAGFGANDHWVLASGVWQRTSRLEFASTNQAWPCRDLTNVNWTPTDATPLKDQTGVDGVANAASSLEATAANGSIGTAITLASSVRVMSMYVKRLVGTGAVQMTTNGGTNWDTVTVTASWTRVSIPARTVTNPAFGIRLATSGDKIAVDFVQNEETLLTSPILTTTAAATRAVDIAFAPFYKEIRAMCGMAEFVETGAVAIAAGSPRVFNIGTGTDSPRLLAYSSGSGYRLLVANAAASSQATTDLGATPAKGDRVRLWWWLEIVGSQMRVKGRQSIGSGAFSTMQTSTLLAKDAASWSGTVYSINGLDNGLAASAGDHIRHRVYAGYVSAEAF